MHIRFFAILSLCIISSACLFAQAEPAKVVRSENKVVIERKVYYIHVVQTGQTLYSISRAYNVSQKEIILENPSIFVGLQAGQSLKIPFMPEVEEIDEAPSDIQEDFILHTIEQGQTLFFLSRTYNVGIDDIIRHNPGVEDGLRVNQVIRIPAQKVYITREGFPSEDDNYWHHKVERGETLYSLSRQYDVPVRAIRRANSKLIWGLKYGEYIMIPKYVDEHFDEIGIPDFLADEVKFEPLLPDVYEEEYLVDAECINFNYQEYNRPFNVALMLPLFIERNYPVELTDTIDQSKVAELFPDYVRSVNVLYHETVPFLEFYEGARLAVDSLVRAGISVNLNVYDTERNTDRVRQIIQSSEFQNIDLIIGPVYPEIMRIVSDWARINKVNIVSPLTSRSEFLANNPYLFQVTPSARVELEQASVFITNFPCSNFVFIHNNDPFERETVEAFKSNIFRHFYYSSDFDDLVFKEVVFADASVNIEQSLVAGEKNIVIIPSSNQAFVSDMLIRLNILSRMYDITIFGLNDWQRFANLEVEYLHNLELHYASPFFIDYKDQNVKNFLKRFRNQYKTEPSHYGFQGYDIMFYFLEAMKNYGPEFHECLPVIRTNLLQADFLFRKSDYRHGFENNGISIVKYDKDLNITRLGLNSGKP